jgi:hypothetical protein
MPRSSSSKLVFPPLQLGVVRTISDMEYLVPQPFAAGGNWVVSKFVWSITGSPRYLGYSTPTKLVVWLTTTHWVPTYIPTWIQFNNSYKETMVYDWLQGRNDTTLEHPPLLWTNTTATGCKSLCLQATDPSLLKRCYSGITVAMGRWCPPLLWPLVAMDTLMSSTRHYWIEICIQFLVQNAFCIQLIRIPRYKSKVHNIYINI